VGSGWLGDLLPGQARRAYAALPARHARWRSGALRPEDRAAGGRVEGEERHSATRAAAASAADKSSDKKADEKPAEKKPDAASDTLPIDVSATRLLPMESGLRCGRATGDTGEKKQKDAKADASRVDHETHGTRLYLVALKADGSVDGALQAVAVAPDVHLAVWAPAADRLAVMTEGANEISDLGPAGAAWLVNATTPQKPLKLDGFPPRWEVAQPGARTVARSCSSPTLPKMHRRGMTSCLRCRWMRTESGLARHGGFRRDLLDSRTEWLSFSLGTARLWPWRAWARA